MYNYSLTGLLLGKARFVMEKLENIIIHNFTLIIFLFALSWIGLVAYGLIMQ